MCISPYKKIKTQRSIASHQKMSEVMTFGLNDQKEKELVRFK